MVDRWSAGSQAVQAKRWRVTLCVAGTSEQGVNGPIAICDWVKNWSRVEKWQLVGFHGLTVGGRWEGNAARGALKSLSRLVQLRACEAARGGQHGREESDRQRAAYIPIFLIFFLIPGYLLVRPTVRVLRT